MNTTHRSVVLLMTSLCLLAHLGCASMTGETKANKKDSAWQFFKKKEYQTPQSINATWTHDVYTTEGKAPTRGFGGRLYFYNERSQAIPVDGELIVYGFDDTQRNHEGMGIESADKKFRFTAEQFTTHFSESQLGASYSIWIPWDAAPGNKKKIMLIPTFKSKSGQVIRGNAATLLLPGPPSEEEQLVIQASAIKAAKSAAQVGGGESNYPSGTHPKTTTIPVPARSLRPQASLSAEKASSYSEQIQQADAIRMGAMNNVPAVAGPIASESNGFTGVVQANVGQVVPEQSTTVQSTTVPASSVATRLPAFSIPFGGQLSTQAFARSPALSGSALPGFAQATLPGPTAHSSPNLPQVPTSSVSPSSSYPAR